MPPKMTYSSTSYVPLDIYTGFVPKFENHFPDFSIPGLLRFPNFSRYFYYVYMSKNTNSNYMKSNLQVIARVLVENPMAVSINSLNWLMISKVFQFVLHTRKIIAKRWNNQYPCWVIFQVSPHTFHDFSKNFSIPKVIFHDFRDRENLQFEFQTFPGSVQTLFTGSSQMLEWNGKQFPSGLVPTKQNTVTNFPHFLSSVEKDTDAAVEVLGDEFFPHVERCNMYLPKCHMLVRWDELARHATWSFSDQPALTSS